MRTITYGGAVSLDGFLAGPAGEVDWLIWSPDAAKVTKDYWIGVDTILMGRKTYAVAAASQPQPKPKRKTEAKAKAKAAAKKSGMRTYVFSRTLEAIDDPNVELVRTDAAEFVRELKSRPGGKICLMGGGELATSLLAAGLVDEVGLNIHPIVLGSGVPVFRDPGRRVKLELRDAHPMQGGCLMANYVVRPRP